MMIFPPACWGNQRRVCGGGNCHCEQSAPRNYDTLNHIGGLLGRSQAPPRISNEGRPFFDFENAHMRTIDRLF